MTDACPSCGVTVENGAAGCQALFDQLLVREFSDYRYAPVHRMTVDTYAAQHAERYCASAKSLVAHVGGLCCAFEYGAHRNVMQALQRWLNGTPAIDKPELPSFRGALTIRSVLDQPDPQSYAKAAHLWARSAWDAYAELHPLARSWIEHALAGRQPAR
jgi:hypothetical protein